MKTKVINTTLETIDLSHYYDAAPSSLLRFLIKGIKGVYLTAAVYFLIIHRATCSIAPQGLT